MVRRFDQRDDRLPNVLGKVRPRRLGLHARLGELPGDCSLGSGTALRAHAGPVAGQVVSAFDAEAPNAAAMAAWFRQAVVFPNAVLFLRPATRLERCP